MHHLPAASGIVNESAEEDSTEWLALCEKWGWDLENLTPFQVRALMTERATIQGKIKAARAARRQIWQPRLALRRERW